MDKLKGVDLEGIVSSTTAKRLKKAAHKQNTKVSSVKQ